MSVTDHYIITFTGSLNMKRPKIEDSANEAFSLDCDVLNLFVTQTHHLPPEKPYLFGINNAPICDNPKIQIVVGPLNEKNHP